MKAAAERIACLTAYDASFARVLDEAGVDVILVGDSLGMVIQGHDTTVPVTMDDMVYHTRCVAGACRRALLIADMPFMSYATPEQALRNAARLMQEGGASMVKLESTNMQVETVAQMTAQGIPVCAHLGLRPQSVHKLGGYKVQGRDEQAAKAMLDMALALERAGADLLLLECVPAELGEEITKNIEVPVIGIGAGAACDGQILVLQDTLGISHNEPPRFSKNFLQGENDIPAAIKAYITEVRQGSFPAPEHSF